MLCTGPSRDANWLHVINECGRVGYVPKNYIADFEVGNKLEMS